MTDPVTEALAAAAESPLVTKWIAVAEIIGKDGGRELMTCTSEQLPIWDGLGMLDFAATLKRGYIESP